jgi:hypothetical protein
VRNLAAGLFLSLLAVSQAGAAEAPAEPAEVSAGPRAITPPPAAPPFDPALIVRIRQVLADRAAGAGDPTDE